MTTRLFILTEVRLYREGLGEALGRVADVDVVGAAAHRDEALDAIAALHPDVVLVDLDMPRGRDVVRALADASPTASIVALAVPDDDDEILAWAEAGVRGYVDREASLDQLLTTIRSVARGEILLSPRVAATLVRRVSTLAVRGTDLRQLTAREAEIVTLIDRGYSNKQIAQRLYIELPTVKNHVHNILEKLNVQRRSEAAARWRALESQTLVRDPA